MTKRTMLTTSAVAAAMIVLATVIYWASASGATNGITTPQSSSNPAAQAAAAKQSPSALLASVEASQLAQFSVLGRRGTTFPSTFATSLNGGAMKAQYGLNVALAKPVGNSGDAWLIPGKGELCVWLTNAGGESGGLSCAATSSAIAGELEVSRMGGGPNAVQHIVGIVPDGTTAVTVSGSSNPISIQNNSWEATTGPDPSTANITTPSGTKTVEVP